MSEDPARLRRQLEIDAWLRWLADLRDAGSALLRLLAAELRLASSDLKRFLLLSLLVLPLVVLAWLGLALFLSWIVYALTGSLGGGFAGFFLLHVGILLVIRRQLKRYKQRMSLPETRKYIGVITEELRRAPERTNSPD